MAREPSPSFGSDWPSDRPRYRLPEGAAQRTHRRIGFALRAVTLIASFTSIALSLIILARLP